MDTEQTLRDEIDSLQAELAAARGELRRLRTEGSRLTAVIDQLPCGLMIAEAPSGRLLLANAQMERIWQRPVRGLEGIRDYGQLLGFHHDTGREYADEEWPLARAILRGEAVRGEEITFVRGDSNCGVVSVSATPVQDSEGRIIAAVAVFDDITELTEALRSLRESEERFRLLVDGVKDYALYLTDTTGRVISWNAGAERITGYSIREILGQSTACFYPPEEMADGQPPTGAACGQDRWETEGWRLRKDGSRYWAHVITTALHDDQGFCWGQAVVVRDITEFHELQEQQRVFLHTVSHDLRFPLTIILGHVSLLQELIPAEETATECMDAIQRGVRRMNFMIDDLVDTARLEGGQLPLAPRPLALADYLPQFLRRNAVALDTTRIQLAVAPATPLAHADPDRLERMLINLLTNALKYSPAGAPVRLSAAPHADGVCLAVADQGPGIPAEELPDLFSRFYRVKSERKGQGIGLGLYITKLLAEAHGGRIWADSRPGHGSTFSFTLPAAPEG
ncbi:MAG: sensor histidine kinase [Armatimonadota bacterium]